METLKCKYCDFTVSRCNKDGRETGFKHLREHCESKHREIYRAIRSIYKKNPYVEIEEKINTEFTEDSGLNVDILNLDKVDD